MMRKMFVLGVVLVLFFVLCSASEAANLKIIGKWFTDGQQIEFLKDGTFIDVKHGASQAGSYKFIDNNRIKVELGLGAMVYEVSIGKEGQLILTDPAGNVAIYFTKAEWGKRVAAEKAKAERKRAEQSKRESAERESAERAEREKRRAEEKAEWEKFVKERFTISDLTVLHKETKLMWTRDANIAGKEMNWDDAFKFIEGLNQQKYAGYSDWRLPSKEDLETLVNFAKGQGYTSNIDEYFNKIGFKKVKSTSYWSSTTSANNTASAWIVNMSSGDMTNDSKTDNDYVWPVRSGQ